MNNISIKKVVIGQNINVIIDDNVNPAVKCSKRIIDKEERSVLVTKVAELQELIEKSKSEKVKNKHIDTLISLFTSKVKEIEKKKEKEEVVKKALTKKTDKTIKKLDKAIRKEEIEDKKAFKTYTIGVINKLSKDGIKKEAEQLVITSTGIALKGFEAVPMPKLLVEKILEFTERRVSIQFLINFWYKCLANPNHIARTKLFDYLVGQNIIITPSGNFITYRMVKDSNRNGEKLDNYYTDAHTYTMRYVPGTVCQIPRSECDEDGSKDCSKGLHTGNPRFIGINVDKSDKDTLGDGYKEVTYSPNKGRGYAGGYGTGYDAPAESSNQSFSTHFGNVPIICIVNPSNVVSVPDSDTRKMRSCEFYFVKTTTVEEVIALEAGDYLLFDQDYESIDILTLKATIKGQGLTNYIYKDSYRDSDLTKLRNKLGDRLIQLKLNDTISKDLSLEQIKQLVKNRIK